jgi:hypothetical protein
MTINWNQCNFIGFTQTCERPMNGNWQLAAGNLQLLYVSPWRVGRVTSYISSDFKRSTDSSQHSWRSAEVPEHFWTKNVMPGASTRLRYVLKAAKSTQG